ncbi:MAG: hypothetical protein C4291_10325 [Candidatus Dadabacteria bacterium]
MNVLGRIYPAFLILLFLTASVCYGEDINSREVRTSNYFSRGEGYLKRGMLDKAIAEFSEAIKINPRDANAYYNRGIAYYYKGQYDQAISDFNKVLEINPGSVMAYKSRGLAYQKKGQYDKAISDYDNAIKEIDPVYTEIHINRGVAYARSKGEYDKAISDYSKAIEINPKNALAYYNRGIAYQAKGRYDKAISDYSKAIEINPSYAAAYINRGIVYANRGLLDQAASDYNRAVEIDPKYGEAIYQNAYVNKDRNDKAISGFNKTLKISPIYDNNKDAQYDQAIYNYTKAIEANPRDAQAYYHRGVAYYNKGQYDKAIADFNKAIELNPDYDRPINGLAYLLALDNKQLNKALELSRHSLELKPDEPYYWSTLAEIYYRMGRISDARIANNNAKRFAKEESLIKSIEGQRQRIEARLKEDVSKAQD